MKLMLYLYVDQRQIKILQTKRALLGQQEVSYFEKKFEVDLIDKGQVANTDHLASAVKEGLTSLSSQDKDIFLILPQESFHFLKADVPTDIADSAVRSFVYDKARSTLAIDLDSYFSDYYVRGSENQKHISFFAVSYETLQKYADSLNLLNLRIVSVLPETLALFKLFEKTLRQEKKENILYASYTIETISGYLYDSTGLVSEKKWLKNIDKNSSVEKSLKEEVDSLKKEGTKLNRIILSGEQSESIRQDTFTKNVGVWTNPLKRIIPNFYEEYLKQLVVPSKQVFPILVFDVCFGAFVFSQENREFQMLKKPMKSSGSRAGFSLSKLSISVKEIMIFVISLVVSFAAFFGISNLDKFKSGMNLNIYSPKPTPIPSPIPPTPTPLPPINKEKLRIKILNGSGTKGRATDAKDILTKKGYQEILTGNADNFDYTKTVIQVKKSAGSAAEVLKEDLKDSTTSIKVEDLDAQNAADVIIIIGSDFK